MQDLGSPFPFVTLFESSVPAHEIAHQWMQLILGSQLELDGVH